MSVSDRTLLVLLLLLCPAALWLPGLTVMYYPEQVFLLQRLPWVTLAAALLLSQVYQQGRLSFLVILSSLMYGLIQLRLQSSLSVPQTELEFWLMGLLGPAIALGLVALPDQGPFHRKGWLAWALLLGSLALLAGLTQATELSLALHEWMRPRAFLFWQMSPAPLLLVLWQLMFACAAWLLYLYRGHSGDMAAMLICASLMLVALGFARPLIAASVFAALGIVLFVLVLQHGHQIAFLDDLTGIPGRRALNLALQRLGRRYTLAMTDIDHFKSFNDTYGHDVGDEVLKLVAARLSRVRGGAQVYRYGGEEFTIVFAGKQPKQCKAYLEAIRQDIAEYPFSVRAHGRDEDSERGRRKRGKGGGESVQITLSFGVACRSSAAPVPERVIKAADTALYAAKKAGRNCIRMARAS
ncbi:GGDEF domain-containing protein [Ferrimonas pelagia]|uniref:diguanylate cyclase n=1 Tax=Ferrimonas pelagia TaxID=1177826 RepID=A0ABP9EB59_9GAMM